MAKEKKIRIGVIGARRGHAFMDGASNLSGLELVAICDTWEERLLKAQKQYAEKGGEDRSLYRL